MGVELIKIRFVTKIAKRVDCYTDGFAVFAKKINRNEKDNTPANRFRSCPPSFYIFVGNKMHR